LAFIIRKMVESFFKFHLKNSAAMTVVLSFLPIKV